MRATADLRRRILNRTARVAVVGQGYVGLSLACAAADAGFCVTGIDVDARRVAALAGGRAGRRRRRRAGRSASAFASGRLDFSTSAEVDRREPPGLHLRADAAARRHARPVVHRRRLRGRRGASGARVARRARVDHVPGDHRGAGQAAPRDIGARRRTRLPAGLLAGADRPGQRGVHVPPGAARRRRAEPGVHGRRGPVLRAARRQGHAGLARAARPSSRSCWRTRSAT